MPKKKPTKKRTKKKAATKKRRRRPPSSVSSVSPAKRVVSVAPNLSTWLVNLVQGNKLTLHQVKVVCDFLEPVLARSPQALLVRLGFARKLLRQWEGEGAPRNADLMKTWPLAKFLRWLKEKWKAQRTQQLPLEMNWDERFKKAKALTAEDEYARSHGELMLRELTGRLLGEEADILILVLKGLPDLAAQLAQVSEARARAILTAYRDRGRAEITSFAARCVEGLGEASEKDVAS